MTFLTLRVVFKPQPYSGDLDSVFAVSVLFLAPGTFVLSSEAFPAGIQLDLVG